MLVAHIFLQLSNIPLPEHINVSSCSLLKDFGLPLNFNNNENSCSHHLYAGMYSIARSSTAESTAEREGCSNPQDLRLSSYASVSFWTPGSTETGFLPMLANCTSRCLSVRLGLHWWVFSTPGCGFNLCFHHEGS